MRPPGFSCHHFAYMIISVALLGFGASGTALALRSSVCSRASAPASRFLRRSSRSPQCSGRGNYAAALQRAGDRVGGAADCLAGIELHAPRRAVLLWCERDRARVLTLLGRDRPCLRLRPRRRRSRRALRRRRPLRTLPRRHAPPHRRPRPDLRRTGARSVLEFEALVQPLYARVAAIAVALWLPPGLTAIHPYISEDKGLSMALRMPDAKIIAERSGPLGLVTVVESPTIPFRHAPASPSTISLSRRFSSASLQMPNP